MRRVQLLVAPSLNAGFLSDKSGGIAATGRTSLRLRSTAKDAEPSIANLAAAFASLGKKDGPVMRKNSGTTLDFSRAGARSKVDDSNGETDMAKERLAPIQRTIVDSSRPPVPKGVARGAFNNGKIGRIHRLSREPEDSQSFFFHVESHLGQLKSDRHIPPAIEYATSNGAQEEMLSVKSLLRILETDYYDHCDESTATHITGHVMRSVIRVASTADAHDAVKLLLGVVVNGQFFHTAACQTLMDTITLAFNADPFFYSFEEYGVLLRILYLLRRETKAVEESLHHVFPNADREQLIFAVSAALRQSVPPRHQPTEQEGDEKLSTDSRTEAARAFAATISGTDLRWALKHALTLHDDLVFPLLDALAPHIPALLAKLNDHQTLKLVAQIAVEYPNSIELARCVLPAVRRFTELVTDQLQSGTLDGNTSQLEIFLWVKAIEICPDAMEAKALLSGLLSRISGAGEVATVLTMGQLEPKQIEAHFLKTLKEDRYAAANLLKAFFSMYDKKDLELALFTAIETKLLIFGPKTKKIQVVWHPSLGPSRADNTSLEPIVARYEAKLRVKALQCEAESSRGRRGARRRHSRPSTVGAPEELVF